MDRGMFEDALALTDTAYCKEPTLRLSLSLDTHILTHIKRERHH